jgi:hypothetical protein
MTAGAADRQTQFICETDPDCLCLGGEPGTETHNDDRTIDFGGECLCVVSVVDEICSVCKAPMVEIDFDTGEKVRA